MKRTRLRRKSQSPTALLKDDVQSWLRAVVIARDKGCVLRDYPEAGKCNTILQAEHLNSRTHMISFGDSRIAVCLCSRHHIFWKPTNSARYWEIIEEIIGPTRWNLFQRIKADRMSHKIDLKLAIIQLKRELKDLEPEPIYSKDNNKVIKLS